MTNYTGNTWFCCATAPRAEKRAELALKELGFEVFSPMELHWSRKGVVKTVTKRRKAQSVPTRTIEKPVFPSYVFFACSDPSAWGQARRADGVQGVVGQLHAAGLRDLREIQLKLTEGAFDYTKSPEPIVYEKGVSIKVRTGHFAGWLGKVERMEGTERVRLMLDNMLGGKTAVTVELENVEEAA